jgi:uncharacterized protein (TIGR00661 family)
MKILYGACGEGMGHAMRSDVVAEHLQTLGHSVTFASSGPALRYLKRRWPAFPVMGLGAVIKQNKVCPEATLFMNSVKSLVAAPLNFLALLNASLAVQPDVVISDFEPWSARYAHLTGIPLIAVDNIHFMNRCTHPHEVTMHDRAAAALMYPIVDNLVPYAQRYLVTTFAYAPVCRDQTSLHLPILRPEILRARAALPGNHVITYFNAKADHAQLTDVMHQVGVPCRAYGMQGLTQPIQSRNVTLCPFSDAAFIADVASAQAVIAGAGFTVMTEAIYLGKPMLAVPFAGHFEQILNANYLARLGFGERCAQLTADRLRRFLWRLPMYRARLSTFQHDDNRELLHSVRQALAEVCS